MPTMLTFIVIATTIILAFGGSDGASRHQDGKYLNNDAITSSSGGSTPSDNTMRRDQATAGDDETHTDVPRRIKRCPDRLEDPGAPSESRSLRSGLTMMTVVASALLAAAAAAAVVIALRTRRSQSDRKFGFGSDQLLSEIDVINV
eukprot:NODE_4190_length_848_cov_14.951189_g3865_i0.p1 GENE.NODE_4190_length_848_cov_14.951189_g3865_i0~~NODE_4190_length_848_cov_14.951189_g3865_i0.p1  ORF type:complete len:146 (+),score=15.09 NODE_4190_length_848_cov_14.951189_g3865_i0:91-528(+)